MLCHMEGQQMLAFEPLSLEAILHFSCYLCSGETLSMSKSSFCIRPLICIGQGSWFVCSAMAVKTMASLVNGTKVNPWYVFFNHPIFIP